MQVEAKDLLEKLEFDKVVELLEKECLGSLGRESITSLDLYTDVEIITRLLLEVNEYKISISDNDHFPISTYNEINNDLKMLEIEDYVLPIEGMQRVNVILLLMSGILRFFNKDRLPKYNRPA